MLSFSPLGSCFSKSTLVDVGQQRPHGHARQTPSLRGKRACHFSLPVFFQLPRLAHQDCTTRHCVAKDPWRESSPDNMDTRPFRPSRWGAPCHGVCSPPFPASLATVAYTHKRAPVGITRYKRTKADLRTLYTTSWHSCVADPYHPGLKVHGVV